MTTKEYIKLSKKEITPEQYEYFLSVLPPFWYDKGIIQVSEPVAFARGGQTYGTYQDTGKGYFYLGDLRPKEVREYVETLKEEPIVYKKVTGTLEEMKEQNKENWDQAEQDVAKGKVISLTNLIGGAEDIHIKQVRG